jgi:hypothetical protein
VHAEELPDALSQNDQEFVNIPKMVKVFFLNRSILESQDLPVWSFYPQEILPGIRKYLQECILVPRDPEMLYSLSESMKPLAS